MCHLLSCSLSGRRLGHSDVSLEFGSFLHGTVVDSWGSSQEFILEFSVVFNNDLLLVSWKSKHGWFFFFGETLEFLKSCGDFTLDHRKDWVTLISHNTRSDTIQSWFKWSLLDVSTSSCVINLSKNSLDRLINDTLHLVLQVGTLKVLYLVQHREASLVEVSISIQFWVVNEVDNCTLLDEFKFLINSIILKLFFGVSQVSILLELNVVSPLVG